MTVGNIKNKKVKYSFYVQEKTSKNIFDKNEKQDTFYAYLRGI